MPIYRYKQNEASHLQDIAKVVTINSISQTAKPALFVDIDAPTLSKTSGDLDEQMGALGYSYVGQDPTFSTTLASQYDNHDAFRSLMHFIDNGPANGFASGAYRETVGAVFPTSVTWYDDNTKAKKIVELLITRNANKTPATETWNMYNTDGVTILVTVVDTMTYSGVNETSRTRTIT